MDRVTTPVVVALGSNLGDRRGHLVWAVEQLSAVLNPLQISSFRETEPVGVSGEQPPYLNAVAVGATTLDVDTLHDFLHDLERQRGRERPFHWAPRTLDLDLILFGDVVVTRENLTVPHPRFRERAFVLEPLAEVAPEASDPVSGRTVQELWAAFQEQAGR